MKFTRSYKELLKEAKSSLGESTRGIESQGTSAQGVL
jgi:hypothetical protein